MWTTYYSNISIHYNCLNIIEIYRNKYENVYSSGEYVLPKYDLCYLL
jgi:hypothetical protein